jgi:hypothetical protein
LILNFAKSNSIIIATIEKDKVEMGKRKDTTEKSTKIYGI